MNGLKENVAFDDIASSEWQTIWTFGDELCWFRKAWAILEKYGLTHYCDKREYGKVLTRVLTLNMIYGEFCKLTFEEYYGYDFSDLLYDDLSDLELGQLYAEVNQDDFVDSREDALRELAEEGRIQVFDALHKELSTEDLFAAMYFTAVSPRDEDGDSIVFSTYEEYCTYLEKHGLDQINELDGSKAYFWLSEGTYSVG